MFTMQYNNKLVERLFYMAFKFTIAKALFNGVIICGSIFQGLGAALENCLFPKFVITLICWSRISLL